MAQDSPARSSNAGGGISALGGPGDTRSEMAIDPKTSSTAIGPGSFRSVLPIVDDLLALAYAQAIGDGKVDESGSVTSQAKELHAALEQMRNAALELPGGHVSEARARELEAVLEVEAEKRRAILRTFASTRLDSVDRLGDQVTGTENGMITPKR